MDNQRASSSYAQTSPTCWEYGVFLSFRVRKQMGESQEALDRHEDSNRDKLQKWREALLTKVAGIAGYVLGNRFQKDLIRHEERFPNNIDKVKKWRKALTKVAGIAGYVLGNRSEAEVVQEIVEQISTELSRLTPMNLDSFVGLDSPIRKLKSLIDVGSDVSMIGISGMAGIGKTTIARVFYYSIYLEFEGSSFLRNVSQNSENDEKIISLQKRLLEETLKGTKINIVDVSQGINVIKGRLRNKKILVILDDVTHVDQLWNLVGKGDSFGSGSKIIITTRDERLLFGVNQVCKVELLNHYDSLELFSLNAFKKSQPPKDYLKHSESIVRYSCGLPLALKVLGCSLYGNTDVNVWDKAIERLRDVPEDGIINKLKISFDGLSGKEKEIFLDIACFFKGESRRRVTDILDACGFHATIGISTLIQRHLITISPDGTLWMHDLLQEMGREIVKRESLDKLGTCNRLWKKKDICDVLIDNTISDLGLEAIEGIMVEEDLNLVVSAKAFSKMRRLRLLKIKNLQIQEGTFNRLSNNLRLLEWHGNSFKSLPSSLELDKIVEIILHQNNIESLWNGSKQLSELRSINLKNCHELEGVLDLTGAPNLWKLHIEGYPKLHKILIPLQDHEEFDSSKQLRYISLKDCHNLEEIPDLSHAPNLSGLWIKRCPKFQTIVPHLQGHTEIVPWKQLTFLRLEDCQKLMEMPDLGFFPNLRKLYILQCPTLRSIHSPFLVHENLEDFRIFSCTHLEALPNKIHMKSLRNFVIGYCPKVENFPEIAGSMNLLKTLYISGTAIGDMALSDVFLPALETFELTNNSKLATLPSTLSGMTSLSKLQVSGPELEIVPESLMLPSLSGSTCSLKELVLNFCNLREDNMPSDFFPSLVSLEKLDLSSNDFVSLPITINCLSKLRWLRLNSCKSLRSLTELPQSTYKVELNDCRSIETLSGAFKVSSLECINCFKLLDGYSSMFSMLKNYLKGPKQECFRMVVPGDEIPEWVKHQGEGSSITMERPLVSAGVVACCVFVVDENLDDLGHVCHYPRCSLSDFKRRFEVGSMLEYDPFLEHFFLQFYDPGDELYGMSWDGEGVEVSWTSDPGVEVKKCGVVHPIYEQGLNDFNATTSNQCSSSLGDSNECPEEYFTASEELSDTDSDGPQPKRLKSV